METTQEIPGKKETGHQHTCGASAFAICSPSKIIFPCFLFSTLAPPSPPSPLASLSGGLRENASGGTHYITHPQTNKLLKAAKRKSSFLTREYFFNFLYHGHRPMCETKHGTTPVFKKMSSFMSDALGLSQSRL